MTAQEKTWVMTEMASLFRTLTGRPTTGAISDNDIYKELNDFYRNHFPNDARPKELVDWFTQELLPTDDGEYSLTDWVTLGETGEYSTDNVLRLLGPATIDEDEIGLSENAENFWLTYPKDTGTAYCITDPALAIGSTVQNVLNAAFNYRIDQNAYAKAAVAAGTALSGDTVPQSKYGAWRLEIDSDGTISIVEAADNATGYDTAAQAMAGIEDESSSNACMGYVTVINTSGTFVPGTTALNATGVTATYTDHFHSTRDRPACALTDMDKLFVRPKADDIFQFKSRYIKRPAALDSGEAPFNIKWGRAIACGAAAKYLMVNNDAERAAAPSAMYEAEIANIQGRKVGQMSETKIHQRRF